MSPALVPTVFGSLLIAIALLTESATPTVKLSPNATEVIAAQAASGSQLATAQQLASATNRAARSETIAQKSLAALKGKRSTLRKSYNAQLAEIDKLGRQRASWNRDRQLSKKKSASAALAKQLAKLDKQLRRASRVLQKRRQKLLRAVESELGGSVAGKRASELRRLRAALGKRLRPKAKKIIVPELAIDRLADPEELEEQASLIARAERQLRKEDEKLEERYRYYLKQQKLRAQSERATEIARRDDESVRRSPGLGSSDQRGGASNQESEPGPQSDGDPNEGGAGGGDSDDGVDLSDGGSESRDLTLESSSVILADVVDDVTAADLRRAGRSANPGQRAKAAKKARAQLKAKLKRLRKQRKLIEKRARELRSR